MANEIRIRGNLVSGTLSVALLAGDTTMSSAGLASLPAVTSTGHAVLICENEIIYVTAHTASATTATILRGQEGTSAAAHAQNVAWLHGPVVSDYDSVLGYMPVTANQGTITVVVDLTGLTVTVTVPYAQHRIKITGEANFSSTVATDGIDMQICEGATILQDRGVAVSQANQAACCHAEAVIVPTAGPHTYKLRASRFSGTGTVTMQASATQPAFILVEDLGPAL